jgi:hypothetical protein
MLRKLCRRQRLTAQLHKAVRNGENGAAIFHILEGDQARDAQSIDHNKLVVLDDSVYDAIFHRLKAEDDSFIHYKVISNGGQATATDIISCSACPVTRMTHKGRSYSIKSDHPGGSSVVFKTLSGEVSTGFILSLWMKEVRGIPRTFAIVSPHSPLNTVDEALNPWISLPFFLNRLVYAHESPTRILCDASDILSHAPYYIRPAGTYQIASETMIVHNYLNRARK